MREILFRGKLIFKDEWTEGSLIIDEYGRYYIGKAVMSNATTEYWCSGGRQNGKVFSRFVGFGFQMVIPETVGQCIGLTDKNGKHIFEGDIVKLFLVDGVVEVGAILYNDLACRFMFRSCENNYSFDNTCVFEVIGNIYDNPELPKCEV